MPKPDALLLMNLAPAPIASVSSLVINDGVWNETGATLDIGRRHFYTKLVFYLSAALALTAIGIALFAGAPKNSAGRRPGSKTASLNAPKSWSWLRNKPKQQPGPKACFSPI